MKLLHVDASILGGHSVSRQLSAAVVARLRQADPALEVVYHDLVADPLDHLSAADLAGTSAPEAQARSAAILAEFLAADIVVVGAAMYNFTVPSQLKAWIDRILVAGKTFRYSETGVEGLAAGKRVILAVARGGHYGAGSPFAAAEHLETYLRTVFGFVGITSPEVVVAEGLAMGEEQRNAGVAQALQAVAELAAA